MNKYRIVELKHHEGVASVIEDHEINGWELVTYNTAQWGEHYVRHYLLFRREGYA